MSKKEKDKKKKEFKKTPYRKNPPANKYSFKEIMGKFWFVFVTAIALIVAFVFVTYEDNRGKIPGKTYQGQNVVFTIGDEFITAEMLYDKIYEQNKDEIIELLYQRMEMSIINQSVPITKEMKTNAENYVNNAIIPYFQNSYGNYYMMYLQNWMSMFGFKEVKELTSYALMVIETYPKLLQEFYSSNLEIYFSQYSELANPRLITHILVIMEDPENPSPDNLTKITQIEEALKTRDFKEVAKEFSDDTNSAIEDGIIGILDNSSKESYVQEFSDAAMKLQDGEVSEWIPTIYGWHLIKNLGSDQETLKENETLFSLMEDFLNNRSTIIAQKAMELGYDFFSNNELKEYFHAQLEVEE